MVTDKGSHLDIRLPCVTSALATSRDKSNAKLLKKHTEFLSAMRPGSPESSN